MQQIMTHFNRAMLPKLLLHDYEKKMIKMRLLWLIKIITYLPEQKCSVGSVWP